MKLNLKYILLGLLAGVVVVLLAGCALEEYPYDQNDADGKTVSVCYDANGGFFTTNTSIIVDSYDPSSIKSVDGRISIPLLPPDDKARGNDAFAPVNNGYFLAGWYRERTKTTDEKGNESYIYGGKWDFETDRLEVDADGIYTSSEPVMTLYAAWVPLFSVEFYDKDSDELITTLSFDPTQGNTFSIPKWNEETGALEMYRFPTKNGYTFENAYYDYSYAPISKEEITHPGRVDEASGTAENSVLKLQVSYREGEWYRIYNADQFLKNASVTGSYEIYADLDFTDAIWPTALMYGNYSGTILGQGHTFSNIKFSQTNNSKTNAGLFGALTDTAEISDLTFDNVTFTVQAGTRVAGTNYGLFAGSVSESAKLEGVHIKNGVLQIDSNCYFGTDEYAIGLLCGSGSADIDSYDIKVEAVGANPENVIISVNDESVSVDIKFE